MPHLEIDAQGAKITAQYMGVTLNEYRLLASNYKSPKAFAEVVQECYAKAVIVEYLASQGIHL